MYGCIPVVATDYLYEAFEPEINWRHFGVRVAQKDINLLGEMLDGFSEEELKKKQVCASSVKRSSRRSRCVLLV